MNYKKKVIIRIIIGIVVVFTVYFCSHIYVNSKIIEKYAVEGFEKNPLGDYCKNTSNMVLCVYDAPLFQTLTNLSLTDNTNKIDLIVWVPLYNENLKYGLIITDDEVKRTYHIEVDKNLETVEKEFQDILEKNQDSINKLKSVVQEEWSIDL